MTSTHPPLILIVDDDSGIRSVLRLLLERAGYSAAEAATGFEAIETFQRVRPDIILMDIRMPQMDGATACAEIQRLPGGDRTPVLMITALDDRDSIDRAFEAGATDYLTKPINNNVLRQRVRRLLRTREAEDALRDSEARLSSIIAISADAILLIDHELRIRLTNPGAERIFGYPAPELIGRPIELLLPDWFKSAHAERLRLGGAPQVGRPSEYSEGVGRRKDGSTFPLEISIGAIEEKQQTAFTVTVRDITHRKQAEAEIKRRVEQLAALGQIGQAVTTRLDLDSVLQTLIDEVMSRLEAEGVSVLLRDNSRELIFAAVNGASADRLRGQRIPAEAGIAGQVLADRRTMRVRSEIDRQQIFRDIEDVTRYHALDLIAAPVILGQEAIGVIEAVHSRADVFTDDDARLMEAAASWAAIAIANARQHQSLQRRLRESEAMAAIGRALNETLDLNHVLGLIITSVRQLIPSADRAALLLFDSGPNRVQIVDEYGHSDQYLPADWPHLPDDDLGLPLLDGKVLNIADLAGLEQPRPFGVDETIRALLAAPVRSGEQNFGIITVQSFLPHVFADDDLRLLAMLGDEAAIAIQNARLFAMEHTQRQLAEALRDTAASLTATLDLDEVLDRILSNVGRVVPHDSANIMLVESGVAQVARCQGYPDRDVVDQLLARRFVVMDTPHLQRMSEERHLLIGDTAEFKGWSPPSDQYPVRSFVGATIRFKRKLLGFLSLESRTPGFFEPAYVERLQIFANQAAVAIENARLYQLEQEQIHNWQQNQARLVQTEKMGALGRLATALVEEIRRPLVSIDQHLTQAIAAQPAAADELAAARQDIARLDQITRTVLDVALPPAETRQAVTLNELVQRALIDTAGAAQDYQTQITTALPPLPPIQAAPGLLAQAIANVLFNAIEAAGERGQVHIAAQQDGPHLLLLIINDGPPLRADDLPRIFEPFFTRKAGHAGMGLTVSHNAVQQHGGTLTVENLTNDRGVVVTFRLPATSVMAIV